MSSPSPDYEKDVAVSAGAEEQQIDAPVLQSFALPRPSRRRNAFRTTFAQATILGICSFLAPGIWAAMSATGGGGTQSVSLVNAANSSTFCLMVVTGLLTPTLIRLTNVRFALIFGTLGYAPYAGGLYCFRKYGNGASWFVVLGAVLCGISAGVFWSSEGTVILSYPERPKQGKYLSYWLSFRLLGQLLGGAINLGLNISNGKAGSLSTDTYLVFVVLQCLGSFVAMLLSLPHQVQRSDGTPVLLNLKPTVKAELKAMLKTFTNKRVLLLLPMIWNSTFSESLVGTYNAENFSVRSRALGSLLSAVVAGLSCFLLGSFLDFKRLTLNTRAKAGFIAVYGMQLAWWGWGIYTMNKYFALKPTLDFGQSEWSRGFALYILLQIGFNVQYELTYWLVGAANDNGGDIARLSSIIRSVESAGQAVSYGINSTSLPLDIVAIINAVFCVCAIISGAFVVRKLGILSDGTKLHVAPMYAEADEREELQDALEARGVSREAVKGDVSNSIEEEYQSPRQSRTEEKAV